MKRYWKPEPETWLAFIIIFTFALLVAAFVYDEKVEMPKSYRAWIKQTGNEKCLTYDEWRSLVKVNAKQYEQ